MLTTWLKCGNPMVDGKCVQGPRCGFEDRPSETAAVRCKIVAEDQEYPGWACTKCHRYWGNDEAMARYCCATHFPCKCGGRYVKGHSMCDSCEAADREKREGEALAAAELIDFDGPFLYDEERFCETKDELIECYEADGVDVPEFVFTTTYEPLALDAKDVANQAEKEHHDECEAELPDAFVEGIKAFNEANANNGTHWEDRKHKTRLGKRSNA